MQLSRRALLGAGAFAGLMPRLAFAQSREEALLAQVAPELRDAARGILGQSGQMPAFTTENLPAIRAGMARYAQPLLPAPAWEERQIATADGSTITIFVINAAPGAAKPAILHTHGGGFIIGSARVDLAGLQRMALALDCVIVSVEYRLAPETSWQGSTEDNYAGLKWLHANAAALGVDAARIAVMGESAGGGHAALLALLARDRGEVPLCFQCLVFPMLDDRTGTRTIPPWPIGELIWTAQGNRFGWESFLGAEPGTATVPAAAVPARRGDLAGLPPAWIGVGTLDLFVDEDMDYAQRLIAASVPVQMEVVPDAFHGFNDIAAETTLARDFNRSKLAALARAFGIEPPA